MQKAYPKRGRHNTHPNSEAYRPHRTQYKIIDNSNMQHPWHREEPPKTGQC
jgi:hypothetical protein